MDPKGKLIGEARGFDAMGREREPINIHPTVKERLRTLLFEPEMRGVGFSEFIDRAVEAAVAEIAQHRAAS